jgi:hypothetical protein
VSGVAETVAMICVGWEHVAETYRADAERHRDEHNPVMEVFCTAKAKLYADHAAQIRGAIGVAVTLP